MAPSGTDDVSVDKWSIRTYIFLRIILQELLQGLQQQRQERLRADPGAAQFTSRISKREVEGEGLASPPQMLGTLLESPISNNPQCHISTMASSAGESDGLDARVREVHRVDPDEANTSEACVVCPEGASTGDMMSTARGGGDLRRRELDRSEQRTTTGQSNVHAPPALEGTATTSGHTTLE